MNRKITVDMAAIVAKKFPEPIVLDLRCETDALCDMCEGIGFVKEQDTTRTCPKCNGVGLYNSVCSVCGNTTKLNTVLCRSCLRAEYQKEDDAEKEKLKRRFDKARKISLSDYTGKCLIPGNDIVCDVEDFILHWREDAKNGNLPPKWMFSLIGLEILKDLDITGEVIALCDDEGYEDMTDMLDMKGLQAVEAAYDAWATEQGINGIVYVEDYGCVVLLDELHDLIRKDAADKKGK